MGLLKIKKEIIERKINSELLNLLTEEQSIAKVVSDKSSEICNLICKDYVKIKGNKTAKYVLRSNAFVYPLFDNFEITVIYNFYNFRTYNDYEESINAVSMVGSSSFEKKIITLNFFAISGDVDGKTLYDQCQHEVSHLYRAYMKNGVLLTNKRAKLYNTSVDMMRSNANGGFDSLFGTILYFSFEEEQNAYVNGAYKLMTYDFNNGQPFDILKQTDAYIAISKLKYYQFILNSNRLDDEDYKNISVSLKNFGKRDLSWFKKILDAEIHEFEKSLIRVFYKAKQEYDEYMTKISKTVPF